MDITKYHKKVIIVHNDNEKYKLLKLLEQKGYIVGHKWYRNKEVELPTDWDDNTYEYPFGIIPNISKLESHRNCHGKLIISFIGINSATRNFPNRRIVKYSEMKKNSPFKIYQSPFNTILTYDYYGLILEGDTSLGIVPTWEIFNKKVFKVLDEFKFKGNNLKVNNKGHINIDDKFYITNRGFMRHESYKRVGEIIF